MTRVYVFTNHKGGVGKTTSATTIALGMVGVLRGAGAAKCRVLLIDTDSQAHATLVTTGRSDYGAEASLYRVLMSDRAGSAGVLSECIVPSAWDDDLHVLPGSALLEGAERELMSVPGAPYRLSDPLSGVQGRYGAVVIDTRPSFSLLTEMALVAATDAIIPVEPRYLETVGLLSVLHKIQEVRTGWRVPGLRTGGLLVTKLDGRIRGHGKLLSELRQHPTLSPLLLGVIPANEAVSYAHEQHRCVLQYDAAAPASKTYAAVVARLLGGGVG